MPCYHPMTAYISAHKINYDDTVKTKAYRSVSFKETSEHDRQITLPCGQCVGCRLEKSRQWAVRCMHEAQLHEDNCFITLTYNDENLPEDLSLNYDHFQTFIKDLRSYFKYHYKKTGIRFYMAGEYGESFGRPHYHACIFGINFSDRKYHKRTPSGFNIYVSKILESLWPYGYSSIGDVTFESAAYVARYIMKKQTGTKPNQFGMTAKDHYTWCDLETGELKEKKPEFNKMSLRPGIGADWLKKYLPDVYPNDFVEVRGKKTTPPKYYDKIYKKLAPLEFDDLEYERHLKRLEKDKTEYTPERLEAKETVQLAKLSKLKRTLT
jgi:hypothetical protein